ncbi:MAG: hypothetical protein LBP52_06515 [Burkholderiaceae bacterium]|jgi:hypothetical protein|nr:hypothetical protein [Burkholderiaceae bacterium]
MTECITQFLLENFPDRSELSYEDFTLASVDEPAGFDHAIECCAYDYDKELAERAFRIISRPWPEIDWFQIAPGGGMVPMFLNKKSFLHAFPSLLNYLCILAPPGIGEGGDNLASNFVERLDFNHLAFLEKEIWGEGAFNWIREFYFSLSGDVKKMIYKILVLSEQKERTGYAEDALASYWVQFAGD